MDTIVTAGGIPQPNQHLYAYTQGKPKALLDICGKPMIQWVLDALESAETVDRIVIVGLPPNNGMTCSKLIACVPSQGGLVENMCAGVGKILESDQTPRRVLFAASDIPAITPKTVNWVVNKAMETDGDMCCSIIARQVMEAHFPGFLRPFPFDSVRLRDVEACVGQIHAIHTAALIKHAQILKRVVTARKNVFRKTALILEYFGYSGFASLFFGKIGLEEAVERLTKRFEVTGRAILCPYPEVGMDVDEPNQLKIMRANLAGRTVA